MGGKFESETVRDAVDRSVRNAPHLRAIHSAPVAALRVLAERIDSPPSSADDAEAKLPQNDNVSIPTFLKYCQALGLVPDLKAEREAAKPAAASARPGQPVVRAVPSFRDVG